MRYHTWTVGCQMNTADTQRLAAELERLGYTWSDTAEDADVVVLNTCVVRQQAEDKVYGRLGSLGPVKAERPDMVIALTGCLVGPRPSAALARRFPDVDVFVPPSETAPLTELLRRRQLDAAGAADEAQRVASQWTLQDADPRHALPARDRGSLVSAHVPVVYGCNWVCTFCIIPSRRGAERSRPVEEIAGEVAGLVAGGVREVSLLGQIVDRYGYDRAEQDGLVHLLARLQEVEELERIRFLTSHPNFMTDRLLDTVAELPKVMEHIEVPVQAGHDRTLARMKRGYTVDDYRRLVARIRARVPGAAIHTDIIVGFPGETEEEFLGTYDLLAELRPDKAHIAKFSARPGTVAVKLYPDDVSAEEKERRRSHLDALMTDIRNDIGAAHVGRTVEVLVEDRDRDRWRGRTRTNKLVYFAGSGNPRGELVDVAIEWAGPWSMVGHTADTVVAAPREVFALEAR